MKILHISAAATGGAGRAAMRVVEALRAGGVDCVLAIPGKVANNPCLARLRGCGWSRLRAHLDRLPLHRYRRRPREGWWSNNVVPSAVVRGAMGLKPDLIHLHWVGDGLLRPMEVASARCPVVWTLHDMWPFTGGCHYSGECRRYESGCGACPQLVSRSMSDLSAGNAARKIAAWRQNQPAFVAPSHWMAECARSSAAVASCQVSVIRYCLPLDRFAPRDREQARLRLGVPRDAFVMVGGAFGGTRDPRKGFSHFTRALAPLRQMLGDRRISVVLFGGDEAPMPSITGVSIHGVGVVGDEVTLSWIYSAADVVVVPSIQDNLPNVMIEALACGTTVVGFRRGGVPEMLAPRFAGRVAESLSGDALAGALAECARDPVLGGDGRARRVEYAREQFAPARIASEHHTLYEGLLARWVKGSCG